jgi:hypothetical protein
MTQMTRIALSVGEDDSRHLRHLRRCSFGE